MIVRNKENITSLEIKTVFPELLDNVFAFVTNPVNYPEIHPLITKVVKRNNHHYLCFETSYIFLIPYPFHYWVRVSRNLDDGSVIMKSDLQNGLKIALTFFKNQGFITEKINIEGPCIPRKLLAMKMKKVHLKIFKNLKTLLHQNRIPETSNS